MAAPTVESEADNEEDVNEGGVAVEGVATGRVDNTVVSVAADSCIEEVV